MVPKCWAGPRSHPHHVISRGAARNDYLTVPLCWMHHVGSDKESVHKMGVASFQKYHGVDFKEVVFNMLARYTKTPGKG